MLGRLLTSVSMVIYSRHRPRESGLYRQDSARYSGSSCKEVVWLTQVRKRIVSGKNGMIVTFGYAPVAWEKDAPENWNGALYTCT